MYKNLLQKVFQNCLLIFFEKHLSTKNIGVISGPSFAIDLVSKMPAGLTLASKKKKTRELAKQALKNKYKPFV